MPDITVGDNGFDTENYTNGGVVKPSIYYGQVAFNISEEGSYKSLHLGVQVVIN